MEWLWTWGGKCFGYRLGEELWTYDGKHVARFQGTEIYGATGAYIGELRGGKRLIRDRSKSTQRISGFTPQPRRAASDKFADAADYTLYGDYEDFPGPGSF
jgi:hypothetical protein